MLQNFKKIVTVSIYIIVFLVLLKNSFNYLDPDFGWHLQIGKQIISERQVPNIEYYNYPLLGIEWIDHEWSLNALTYFIFDEFGYFALNIFYAFVVMFVLYFLRKIIIVYFPSTNDLLISVVFLAGVLSSRPSLGLRLQEFTLLFLVIQLFLFAKYSKTRKEKFLYFLPFLFFVWANSHGAFILGLGLFAVFLFYYLFLGFWEKARSCREGGNS